MATISDLPDVLKTYTEQRVALTKSAVVLMFVSLIIVTLARSPDFSLLPPDLVQGNVHNGYVCAYGHFIILLLGVKFWLELSNCLSLRERLVDDYRRTGAAKDAGAVEEYLLRLPFQRPAAANGPRTFWGSQFLPVVPTLMAVAAYTAMLIWYFGMVDPSNPNHRIQQLLTGWNEAEQTQTWQGYHVTWSPSRNGKIWINAPVQTWFGLAGMALFAVFVAWHLFKAGLLNPASPYRNHGARGWLAVLSSQKEKEKAGEKRNKQGAENPNNESAQLPNNVTGSGTSRQRKRKRRK